MPVSLTTPPAAHRVPDITRAEASALAEALAVVRRLEERANSRTWRAGKVTEAAAYGRLAESASHSRDALVSLLITAEVYLGSERAEWALHRDDAR